jgi:hypothetical protein
LDHATEVAPRIPNWEPVATSAWPGAQKQQDAQKQQKGGFSLPRIYADDHMSGGRRQHSRAYVAAAVLACLFVAFVAVAAIVASMHNPTIATADRPQGASTSVVSPVAVSRLQAATSAADAATISIRSQLDQIDGIPTLTDVTALINPYVASLQHYAAVLQTSSVPTAAKTSADTARSLVNQDVEFLGTINGLPSLGLGSYLEHFGQISEDLRTALGALQADLRAPTG